MRKLYAVLGVLIAATMVLSACATPTAAPEAPVVTEAPDTAGVTVPTEAPEETAIAHNGKGAWLDKVIFTAVADADSAVAQLQAGAIDIYPVSVEDPEVFAKVKADDTLGYATVYGSSNQLMVNVVECEDGSLNPFTDMEFRAAMNWAFDRDYVVQEFFGGLAIPKFTSFTGAFPDYARYADVMAGIETTYAYDMEKAQAAVDTRMAALGATKNADGKWEYNGAPVTLKVVIRTEDQRLGIGQYFSTQLETLGFTVERLEKTRTEASPIVWSATPGLCEWHVYTGGWISTAISRDDGYQIPQFNTGLVQTTLPIFSYYDPSPEFDVINEKLLYNDFTSMEERDQLIRDGLNLAMKESWWGVWVNDNTAISPYRKPLEGAYDLAGGFASAMLWPYTMRWADQVGGVVRVAQSGILVQPFNPINGSNWTDDSMVYRGIMDWGLVPNPFTGLNMPKLVEKAELVAKTGTPIVENGEDWFTLSFQDAVEVPEDAWADWDPVNEKWLTVAEMKVKVEEAKTKAAEIEAVKPEVDAKRAELVAAFDTANMNVETMTAVTKEYTDFAAEKYALEWDASAFVDSEIAAEVEWIDANLAADAVADRQGELDWWLGYVAESTDPSVAVVDLAGRDYTTAVTKSVVTYRPELWDTTWHDGSPFTIGDIVFAMIMNFAPGKEGSPIFDSTMKGVVDAYLSHFRGVKITSVDPLVIETYDNAFALDAENSVTSWYPSFSYGPVAWHDLTPAVLAEAAEEIAFSQAKSTQLEVDQTSLIAGETLTIQKKYLDEAAAAGTIPFAPTLGEYITADEAATKYANLQAWYEDKGHLMIGTGVFYVDEVYPTEGTVTLSRYPDYIFSSDEFSGFGAPMIADAEVDGPLAVTKGEAADFNVAVTYADEVYPSEKLNFVSYMLFDAAGTMVEKGNATMTAEGSYVVTLSAETTGNLEAGAAKLLTAVSSKVVSIPTFTEYEFVVQ